MPEPAGTGPAAGHRSVGYVLTGYPRRSETFIASEIYRLERLGVPLRVYVLKAPDEPDHHPVVDRIQTTPEYLPATEPLTGGPFAAWLLRNGGPYLRPLARVAARHPVRLARAAGLSVAQAVRARRGRRLRTMNLKELLWAVGLADRVLRAGDVGHLHAHFAHGTTTVTWLTAILCGLPFSFTGHAKDIYRGSMNPAGLLPRKLCAASFAVTCTGAGRDHLRTIAPDAEVHLVHHGLGVDFADLVAVAPPRTAPDRFRIVGVGRLVAKKGFDVLVEAVAELRDRGVDLELVIAGEDGPEAPALRRLITERGLTGVVELVGTVSQAQLLAHYRSATVFALACRVTPDGDRDGIPNVLVEAMAAGLPVVSCAVSGIPELVEDGVNGLLVPPDDPVALADALLRLAGDPPLRARLAAAATATVVAEFDGDRLVHRMAELFAGATR